MMKAENIQKAQEAFEKWKSLNELEAIVRQPQALVQALSIKSSTGLAGFHDFDRLGIPLVEVNDYIIDVVKELIDKRASILIDTMQQLGIDIEPLSVEREERIEALEGKSS